MIHKEKIEEILEKEGVFVSATVGASMYPMIRNRKDTIVISPSTERLKKYDIPLYKRGDKYILHRIIDVLPESYVICGDNCIQREYDITDKEILGVLTEFYRGEKKINLQGKGYLCYAKVWCALYPLRYVYKRAKGILVSIVKKMLNG